MSNDYNTREYNVMCEPLQYLVNIIKHKKHFSTVLY